MVQVIIGIEIDIISKKKNKNHPIYHHKTFHLASKIIMQSTNHTVNEDIRRRLRTWSTLHPGTKKGKYLINIC